MIKINQAYYLNRLDHSPLVDPVASYRDACRLCVRGDLHSLEAHRAEMDRPITIKHLNPPGYTLRAPSVATITPVVDPNRQLGLFARDASGEHLEVGERRGQGVLFHDTPKLAVNPSVDDRLDTARRECLPMFDDA